MQEFMSLSPTHKWFKHFKLMKQLNRFDQVSVNELKQLGCL